MKIRLLVSLAGAIETFSPGQEAEWDNEDAVRLIEAGYAVPVSEGRIERAVATPAAEKRKRDVATSDSNDAGNP